MSLFIVCAVCVLGLAAASPLQQADDTDWERPEFCSLECPAFVTLRKTQDYEVREYDMTKWVSTEFSANSTSFRNLKKQAFWRLFNYIRGENSQDVKIEMTVPVTTKIYPCDTEGCETNYIMSFYVPSAYQENTPVPDNDEVYVDERPPMTVFVRSYTGWKNWGAHEENMQQLRNAVQDSAKPGFYYKLGYGPYRSPNARNEIWLQAA